MEHKLQNAEVVGDSVVMNSYVSCGVFRQIGIAHIITVSGPRKFFSLGMILKTESYRSCWNWVVHSRPALNWLAHLCPWKWGGCHKHQQGMCNIPTFHLHRGFASLVKMLPSGWITQTTATRSVGFFKRMNTLHDYLHTTTCSENA